MASPLPSQSSLSDSNSSTKSARIITQTVIDAKLNADFEESPNSFDYSNSVRLTNSAGENQPDSMTTSYLYQIQKGKLIQPYGCLLALHEKSLRVIAYSENAPEMLTMPGHAVPIVGGHQPVLCIGTDIKSIFTLPGASALQKARGFEDVSLLNPILVHCKTSGKPFYAIIHRVLGSMIVDFEPVKIYDVPLTAARALQSYNFVAKAITRLHSLPSGSIERLCNTMVKEVFELTGYDRVMAYKFHEDDHGEVIAEITKPGLDPYLGLHYPATDIPQAARFLFLKNKVRMICDCRAKNVKVLQYENLPFDLTLCGSTLRAPHGCHARYMENMNSVASLILAVVVNEGGEENGSRSNSGNSSIQQQKRKRLWGLVVCHNMTSRFVPYPLRCACEFLSQVFASHVNKELELENQILEKNILRTQTLLSDMLMRDAPPLGIISQTPNIMDLVKCDGAALLFRGKIWKLGITPTDYQILDISSWLSERLTDSTTTDSLLDAGYPGALALRDSVCGMVAVRLTVNDMLFWFRTHTAADIRWDGAKHREDEDESRMMMHPTSSFKAFLGIMRNKSLPWKDLEVDAIHSLLPIVKKTFKDSETDLNMDIIHSKINDMMIDSGRLPELEALSLTGEILRLIETANVPIFVVDVDGVVKGWNLKISELTGCSTDFALGNCLVDLVEDSAVDTVKNMLQQAKQGQEEKNIQFNIRRHNGSMGSQSQPISLVVNTCASRDIEGKVVGVFFVGQDITGQRTVMDKLTKIQAAYRAIVQNPNPLIPPIFSIDEYGRCSEWNPSLENLSGWKRDETIDKTLLGEVFGTIDNACFCRLKNHESFVNLRIVLNNAMSGHDSDKVTFGFCARDGEYIECVLCASGKVGKEGRVTGVFCFLQLASQELQQGMQRLTEQKAMNMGKELSYLKRQTRNSLSEIMFSGKILEGLGLGDEQMKKALQISVSCQNQLKKVLDADMDLDTIVDGYLDLEMVEFRLHEVLGASLSQVMMRSNEKGIHIVHNNWEEEDPAVTTKTTTLYGDALRLQQILADFMLIAVKFSDPGGCVGVQIRLRKVRLGESVELGHTEFRISHEGKGIPVDILNQLFEDGEGGEPTTEEGMSVMINKKLVKLMNGDIQYTRAAGSSTFIISLKLAIAQKPRN